MDMFKSVLLKLNSDPDPYLSAVFIVRRFCGIGFSKSGCGKLGKSRNNARSAQKFSFAIWLVALVFFLFCHCCNRVRVGCWLLLLLLDVAGMSAVRLVCAVVFGFRPRMYFAFAARLMHVDANKVARRLSHFPHTLTHPESRGMP